MFHDKVILGIDPGLADTGYGLVRVLANGELECLSYGSIKTNKNQALAERLQIIYRTLNKIIKEFKPDLISVEEIFFVKNLKTAVAVGQARGVVMLVCGLSQLPLVEFKPREVKQAVTTYGAAGKNQVQQMVQKILHLKELPQPDDAADALALGIAAANYNPLLDKNSH